MWKSACRIFSPGLAVLLGIATGDGLARAATLLPPVPSQQLSQAAKAPAPADEPQQPSGAKGPAGPGWISRCVSESRKSPAECSAEETLAMASTGQAVASVIVRMRSDPREPMIIVRIPVGLYLPGGVNVQIDDGKSQSIPLQTCDVQGCYAESSLSSSSVSALKTGKRLSISFQNMSKNNVVLPFPLDNFADAFQKIQ
jgi:invasion protein IalB